MLLSGHHADGGEDGRECHQRETPLITSLNCQLLSNIGFQTLRALWRKSQVLLKFVSIEGALEESALKAILPT
jgi:hypothetical protein